MEENKKIDIRSGDELSRSLDNVEMVLNKSYISSLNSAGIVNLYSADVDDDELIEEVNNIVRFYDITKLVLNKSENMRDKLVTVFNSVRTTGASLLMHIKGDADKVAIRFGVKNTSSLKDIGASQKILEKGFLANFPGSSLIDCKEECLKEDVLDSFLPNSFVSTITDVPALRFEEETKERQFMQGIEKLIDTLKGEDYSILLIADPITAEDLKANRIALENIYSSLVPFSESQYTVGKNESESINESISNNVTESINKSVTESVSHTIGTSNSINTNPGAISAGIGLFVGTIVAPGVGTMIGGAIGNALGFASFSKSKSESDTLSESKTTGTSYSEGKSITEGASSSTGSSTSLQIKFENHTVTQIMKRIDETLKRYDSCADLGMWNCAAYCISTSEYVSQMAASVYHSLVRGKKSSLEDGAVTLWNKDQSKLLINSLKRMEHPRFKFDGFPELTAGTLISSAELAISAGLPNHSVPGIPVIECAEFGRTVASYDSAEKSYPISLGNIYNMHAEEKLPVELDAKSLSSHVFITGSTGSGKSNTVYQLLDSLKHNGVKFLVVEPAKGEYKSVFGQDETDDLHCNVHVYGTNPDISSLLRINPFSFPNGNEDPSKNIHILEHLDRLIEIFNVCWPMYAAMPAVLKEAVEKSYEDCGWNLTESTNEYGNDFYPTFKDVTRNIRTIIDNSEYDKDNKGAYKGALITRLKSLTNGINGLIFTTEEISSENLFDENVIVDLSRVGSSETKALIMGLLVLKLQEHRMTSGDLNAQLKHVTVLEEAHNLLKRTSTEQSQDSGNLQGKSVEMLTNSIAEMRTYGEGFVIADQAPALLDMAVIRNTNTKIIMRLPDKDDRELVGKAANLNDDQIIELAKLPRGVAAVYQNEWIEAVLCKVNHFIPNGNNKYKYKETKTNILEDSLKKRITLAKYLCELTQDSKKIKELKDLLDKAIKEKSLTQHSLYINCIKYLNWSPNEPDYNKLSPIISMLLPEFTAIIRNSYNQDLTKTNVSIWRDSLQESIEKTLQNYNLLEGTAFRNSLLQCILQTFILSELNNQSLLLELYNKSTH